MTILVTGATGTVGGAVVDQLVGRGRKVRALTRNPDAARFPDDVEVVRGDLARPREWADALAGVTGVFLLAVLDSAEAAAAPAESFVECAVDSGVGRVVFLSTDAVTVRRPGSHETHLAVERVIERSGLAWTHVRPGEFMANKLDVWAPSIRAEGVVRAAFPDALGVPVHEADIAEVAVTALVDDGHAGRAYSISGPEALTHREQAAAIGAGLGRDLRFEAQTYGQARAGMILAGIPGEIAEYVLGYQAEYAEEPPSVRPDFAEVVGRPGRTMAQWAADHAADFAA